MLCFLRTCLSAALWGAALACTLPAQAAPLDVSDSELTAQAVLSSLGFDAAADAENPPGPASRSGDTDHSPGR